MVTRITKDRKSTTMTHFFHMTSDVARRPFLTVSDQVRLKLGCQVRLKLGCIKLQGIGRDLERLYILYFEIRVTIWRKDEGSVCTEGQIITFFDYSQNSFSNRA